MTSPKLDIIEELLRANGPSLTGDISNALQNEHGLNPEAARKRIQRRGDRIKTIYKLNFPHNQSVLYLAEQWQSQPFWERLLQIFDSTNSAYGVALHSLIARGGLLDERRFGSISGAPVQLTRHINYPYILEALIDIGLIHRVPSSDFGASLALDSTIIPRVSTTREVFATSLAEQVLIAGLTDWVRKNGLASYDSIDVRGGAKLPTFHQFEWDLVGPSYLRPLAGFDREQKKYLNGFFVADIALHKERMSAKQVAYFVRKCEIIRSQYFARPFLPMLIANWFEDEAWEVGRQNGVMFTTPTNLFGSSIAEALKGLIDLLKQTVIQASDAKKLEEIFQVMTRFEGTSGQLRGAFFEMIIALCLDSKGGKPELRVDVKNDNGNIVTDIDVLNHEPGHGILSFYECKGVGPDVRISLEVVKKWCENTIPQLRDWGLSQPQFMNSKTHKFLFWTSGDFEPDATEYLRKRAAQTQKYAIEFSNGKAVQKFIESTNDRKSIVKVYREQFVLNSLSGQRRKSENGGSRREQGR